jgi:hypothetical protein
MSQIGVVLKLSAFCRDNPISGRHYVNSRRTLIEVRTFSSRMTKAPRFCFLVSMAFGAIAACTETSEGSEDPVAVPSPEVGQLVTALEDVEGFWLIQRFEDFEPSWQNGTPWREAYVQISDDYLTYNVGCNQSGNSAVLGRDGVLRDTGDGSRMQTLQGCEQVREARDRRFFAFFGSSPQVRTLTEGRILMKSGERELVLVRPDRWRAINKPSFSEIEGRWVPQMSTEYDGWESAGFGIGENPGVVTIERERIEWSRCPDAPIRIRWTADARLTVTDAVDIEECAAVARSSDDGPRALMTILNANPAAIRTGQDYITLVDGSGKKGRRIDFRSQESILNPPPPPPMPQGLTPPPPPRAPLRKSTAH